MRNQTNNVFKVKRQKSKILLITLCIFGLLFSYSCSCKNRVSNPDDTPTDGGVTPPPGTVSISEATDNVKASIVKSSTTSISDIKIGFVSANDYAYSLTYTVEDSETDETKKITADDFQVADNVLTAKDSVATKMKQVDSSTKPAVKTITINFTFKANDSNLNNNTQTLSVNVTLTKEQTFSDASFSTDISKIQYVAYFEDINSEDSASFAFTKCENNIISVEQTSGSSMFQNIPKETIKDRVISRLNHSTAKAIGIASATEVVGSFKTEDNKLKFEVTLTFDDTHETPANNTFSVEVSILSGSSWAN